MTKPLKLLLDRERMLRKISGETVMKTQEIDWLGMDGRYFFVALIPDQLGKQTFKIQNEDKIYDENLNLSGFDFRTLPF